MKVTIITAVYNGADVLENTIKSVFDQTYPTIEYLIVDGVSIDGSIEIAANYAKRGCRLISEPDRGVYDAFNKGVRAATGDIIAILNAGDVYSDRNVIA